MRRSYAAPGADRAHGPARRGSTRRTTHEARLQRAQALTTFAARDGEPSEQRGAKPSLRRSAGGSSARCWPMSTPSRPLRWKGDRGLRSPRRDVDGSRRSAMRHARELCSFAACAPSTDRMTELAAVDSSARRRVGCRRRLPRSATSARTLVHSRADFALETARSATESGLEAIELLGEARRLALLDGSRRKRIDRSTSTRRTLRRSFAASEDVVPRAARAAAVATGGLGVRARISRASTRPGSSRDRGVRGPRLLDAPRTRPSRSSRLSRGGRGSMRLRLDGRPLASRALSVQHATNRLDRRAARRQVGVPVRFDSSWARGRGAWLEAALRARTATLGCTLPAAGGGASRMPSARVDARASHTRRQGTVARSG